MRLLPATTVLWTSIVAAALSTALAGHAKDSNEPEPRYDPATVISISGIIQDVREMVHPVGMKGIHVTLRVEKRTVQIYLCPARFLGAFELRLAKGDDIQVTGSKVKFGGSDLILARQVRKNNEVLVLRDEHGRPYWEDEIFKNCLP